MPRVVTVSPLNSTVVASPTTIADDGVESSTITVTLRNTDGNPMPNRAVTLAFVSGTGTLTQPVGVTNQQGVITGSVVSSTNGSMVISASTLGVQIGNASVFAGSSGSGSVSAFTDISRDAANTAGGTLVTLTVADATGTPTVLFGGASATDVTVVNSTTITCRTPATSAGVVGVSCAGVPLTNPRAAKIGGAFEILPVATTTFVSTTFDSGSLPAELTATGSGVTVQTAEKYSGTHAMQTQLVGAASGGDGSYARNTTNLDVSSYANGVYVRYYQKYGENTLANLGDQIKSFLFRRQSGSGQPGWIMQGIGPDFPDGSSPNDTFVSFIDSGILNINGTPNQGRSGIGPTVWTEWVQWQYWDAGLSQGRCKQWVNGQLLFDVTSASLGGTGTDYRFRLGIPYVQNRVGDCVVWIDEVFAGDGFPNPVEV
jgi:hypothetical protein